MDLSTFVYLSSGLFLGWSLGANHLGNVFGTAVGTRMITFATAAVLCSVFVVLGAVISGAGPANTLVTVGAVNALGGAFMVALSAAVAVYWMTKLGMPVSTTETMVGAIVGWNLFTQFIIDGDAVIKIVVTWIVSPFLAAAIAIVLFQITNAILRRAKPHMLRQDVYTRIGLIIAGSFGAYSLGANNIANVMGVFLPVNPFTDIQLSGTLSFSSIQQLFLIGALAIAVGVLTYSHRVVHTVGRGLFTLTPVTAWVVVMSHSIVLFVFASERLEHLLASWGLPTIPLVPVSSSQAVVGAVLGIGLVRSMSAIRWRVAANIAVAWAVSPIAAGALCFVGLFFVQNVFNQQVYQPVTYRLSDAVLDRVAAEGVDVSAVRPLEGSDFSTPRALSNALEERMPLDNGTLKTFATYAEIDTFAIDPKKLADLDDGSLTGEQRAAVANLAGQTFKHRWMLDEALAEQSPAWAPLPATTLNKLGNRELDEKRRKVYNLFRVADQP